jgi:ubiquinone/menaquinone biosynthesis C-methylase UbiE
MTTNYQRVQAYYSAFDEWNRLESPAGALEFARAMRIVDRHLTPDSRVLDLGGGPGRYTIELAKLGHRVVLADLSPALLDQARARIASCDERDRVESIDEVSAEDLSGYSDGSFDAVLAFGPFYHLIAESERSRAAREIARVLTHGGLAFVAFVPRTSGIAGLIERAAQRPDQVSAETLRAAVTSGVFRNCSVYGFQEGYYPRVDEIEALLRSVGLEVMTTVSLRSVAFRIEKELGTLPPALRAETEEVIDALSTWPEVVASSGHALAIARRSHDSSRSFHSD